MTVLGLLCAPVVKVPIPDTALVLFVVIVGSCQQRSARPQRICIHARAQITQRTYILRGRAQVDVVVEVRVGGRGELQEELPDVVHEPRLALVERDGRGGVPRDDVDPPFLHAGVLDGLSLVG